MTAVRKLLVIGGSAGAIGPLLRLVEELPAGAGAAAAVVIHRPSNGNSSLRYLLDQHSALSAIDPVDGEPLRADHIYLAPTDLHLEAGAQALGVKPGPKINSQRPAIDVLFRSAAAAHGAAAVGVVLSGTMDDGASGLLAICRAGGAALVQDPADAEFSDMPEIALVRAPCARAVPAAQLGDAVKALLLAETPEPHVDPDPVDPDPHTDSVDVLGRADVRGTPVGVTCPDCGGSLWLSSDATDPVVTCRVGHSFSPETLAQLQSDRLDSALWAALRSLEEQVAAIRFVEDLSEQHGHSAGAARHRARRELAEERVATMREFLDTLRTIGSGPLPTDRAP